MTESLLEICDYREYYWHSFTCCCFSSARSWFPHTLLLRFYFLLSPWFGRKIRSLKSLARKAGYLLEECVQIAERTSDAWSCLCLDGSEPGLSHSSSTYFPYLQDWSARLLELSFYPTALADYPSFGEARTEYCSQHCYPSGYTKCLDFTSSLSVVARKLLIAEQVLPWSIHLKRPCLSIQEESARDFCRACERLLSWCTCWSFAG